MTQLEIQTAQALAGCRFCPGSWEKRFARDMVARSTLAPEKELSDSQREWLFYVAWRYRTQIRNNHKRYDLPVPEGMIAKEKPARPAPRPNEVREARGRKTKAALAPITSMPENQPCLL
ncbi:MAG: hypothetical protein AB1405_03710 [Bdellovibrionota bacterium]